MPVALKLLGELVSRLVIGLLFQLLSLFSEVFLLLDLIEEASLIFLHGFLSIGFSLGVALVREDADSKVFRDERLFLKQVLEQVLGGLNGRLQVGGFYERLVELSDEGSVLVGLEERVAGVEGADVEASAHVEERSCRVFVTSVRVGFAISSLIYEFV